MAERGLRREVLSLFSEQKHGDQFLEEPAFEAAGIGGLESKLKTGSYKSRHWSRSLMIYRDA